MQLDPTLVSILVMVAMFLFGMYYFSILRKEHKEERADWRKSSFESHQIVERALDRLSASISQAGAKGTQVNFHADEQKDIKVDQKIGQH